MYMRPTIHDFVSSTSAKICSVLRLAESTLWSLFRLGCHGQATWRSFEFRRAWREAAAGGGLLRGPGAALVLVGYYRKSTT